MSARGHIPFDEIRDVALAQIEQLLLEWFPAGRIKGREFEVGDLQGDVGKSLKVNLNTGLWSDFAGGGSGFDLIDLRAAIIRKDRVAAAKDLADRLGVPLNEGNRAPIQLGSSKKPTNGGADPMQSPAAQALLDKLGFGPQPQPPTGSTAPADGQAGGQASTAQTGQPPHPQPGPQPGPQPPKGWYPVVPPPAGTPPPDPRDLRGYDVVYEYRGLGDELLFYVRRQNARTNMRKQIHPLVFGTLDGQTGWHFKHPATPLPLYGLQQLAAKPNSPVLLCEGEKAADAAQRLFPGYACLAWCRGTSGAKDADVGPLAGRDVIVWPDNDKPGAKAAVDILKLLPKARLLRVDDLGEGEDAADLNHPDPQQWLHERLINPSSSPALKLDLIDDIKPCLDVSDFVQGLLLEKSAAVVYGESNAGKTFWATDLSLHVAYGLVWNGRRVEQGGVVYCCLEGSRGFCNRVAAWQLAHGVKQGQGKFAAIQSALNLLDPRADTPLLVKAIQEATAKLGMPVKLVVIDTLSRALAGGNENAPDDMGALVRNMDAIRAETGACVMFIHHCGKDAAKGARGHSLLRAAVDTEIEVVADEQGKAKSATVVKQRELKKGDAFEFELDVHVLGQNRHGEDVTTCIVTHTGITVRKRNKKQDQGEAAANSAYRYLCDLIVAEGKPLPGTPGFPSDRMLRGVPLKRWREECRSRCICSAESENGQNRAITKAIDALTTSRRVACRDLWVWVTKPASGSTS
jgi:KaiC/GvpD/RAD55 family RecA-like ATPase